MAKRKGRNYIYIQKRKPGQRRRKLKKQNYHQPLQQALDKLPITQQLYAANVYHDDWCNIHTGGNCNCDPDIDITPDNRLTALLN